jgi:hypothetical protein
VEELTMLKVLILLDCNHCGLAIEQAQLCNLLDERDWQSSAWALIENLHEAATELGWVFSKDQMECALCRGIEDEELLM